MAAPLDGHRAGERSSRLWCVLRGLINAGSAPTADAVSSVSSSTHVLNFGHEKPFGQQYHDNMRDIMERIGEDSVDAISAAATAAARALQTGHEVYVNLVVGHIPGTETANDRNGNPALFRHTASDWWSAEEYEAMGEGDVLITQHMNESVTAAKTRGVLVVAVKTPYINNRSAPPGEIMPITGPWEAEVMPEDVADFLIESYLPWEQGLVHVPSWPWFPVLASSGNGSSMIHWMITAEVCRHLGSVACPHPAASYASTLLKELEDTHTICWPIIRDTLSAEIAERIIRGGHYFVAPANIYEGNVSNSHPARDGGLASEAHCACSLRLPNRHEPREIDAGGADDITLVGVVDSGVFHPGCAEVELRWVAEAHARGNFVIGIGPTGHDRLREACDAYLPTACAEGGVIETQAETQAICPTGGIINNILMQMLHAQFAEEMIRRGQYPLWQMGVYRRDGREFNARNDKLFLRRGF
jgi:hypothetical protein